MQFLRHLTGLSSAKLLITPAKNQRKLHRADDITFAKEIRLGRRIGNNVFKRGKRNR